MQTHNGPHERREAAKAAADDRHLRETLPPSGSPLTGDGGLLPHLRPPQVRPGTVVAVTLTLALMVGAGLLLWQVRDVLRWVVIALFLAVALNPAVDRLQKRGLKRGLAIGAIYLVLVLVVVALGFVVFPPFVNQVEALVQRVVDLSQQPQGLERALNDLTMRFGFTVNVNDLRAQIEGAVSGVTDALGPLLSVTRGIFTSVTAVVSILLISFYLLLDGARFAEAGLNLFAANQRPRLRRLLDQSAGAVYGYVRGAFSIAILCGILTFIALTILQLPYAVALALLVAVFDLVPLVGATVGATVVVIVVALVDPVKAGILIVFFVIYQQVENNVFQPLIYGRNVKVHPLGIFVAVLVGAQLLGVLGTLLAIPVAEIIRILAVEFLATQARDNGGDIHSVTSDTPVEQVTADAIGTG